METSSLGRGTGSFDPCPVRNTAAGPRSGSRRRRALQLTLERRDVPPAEPPLTARLEGREDALPCELVDRVGAQVEEPRHVLAVQQSVVLLHHDARRFEQTF